MTIAIQDLRSRVRAIVVEVLEIDADELSESSSFTDDFGADSLLIIEMFARFERDLGVRVLQDDGAELDDLATAYAAVERSVVAARVSGG